MQSFDDDVLLRKHGAAYRSTLTARKGPTMKTRTLFSALSDAQARTTGTPAVPMALAAVVATVVAADDANLLAALRNSATDRDQIMQRRLGPLGLNPESIV
jgi:hypothetical protein